MIHSEFRHTITTFTHSVQQKASKLIENKSLSRIHSFCAFVLNFFLLCELPRIFAPAPCAIVITYHQVITVFFPRSVHAISHFSWAGIFTVFRVLSPYQSSSQCIYLGERRDERERQP